MRTAILVALTTTCVLEWASTPACLAIPKWIRLTVPFLIQLAGYLSWTLILHPNYFHRLRLLPHPENDHPLMGQLFNILRTKGELPTLASRWMETLENDGLIAYKGIFNTWRVILTSPETLREVLVSQAYNTKKPPAVAVGLVRTLGSGLLTSEGDVHKSQRRMLSPAFAFRHIQNLFPTFWITTKESVAALDQEMNKTRDVPFVTIIDDWATRLTLDIIGLAAIGRSFNAVNDASNELFAMYKEVFQAAPSPALRLISIVVPWDILKRMPIPSIVRQDQARRDVRNLCNSLIQEKSANVSRERKDAASEAIDDLDILTVALRSGGFTREELIDHMMTFFAAGHETTASAVTWAIYALCCYPNVQAKLRNELLQAKLPNIRAWDSIIAAEDITRIPYLRAVISEVLRFYPSVPMTVRELTKDVVLNGHVVPRETIIAVLPMAINRHRAFWGEDAGEFVPERWLDGEGNIAKTTQNAYTNVTFLHGPRGCIGQSFSKAEFSVILAGWVQSFEFSLAEPEKEMDIEITITQRPKGGLPVVVRPVGARDVGEGGGV